MVRTTRPNQKKVGIANRDTFLRINYMYQAAHLVLTQNPENTEVIRFYAHSLKSMAKKQVLRLHPDIKRTICKKCFMLLVAGVTATVRKKGKKREHLIVKCLECKTPKRFRTDADYKLWADQPEAWFAMFPPEAPLPVPSLPQEQAEGDAESKGTLKPSCSHRRCRRLPHCKNQLKNKRKPILTSSSVCTTEVGKNSDIKKEHEKSVEEETKINHPMDGDGLAQIPLESSNEQNNHNGDINADTTDSAKKSAQFHSENIYSIDCDDASHCKALNCDMECGTEAAIKGIKRQLTDSGSEDPSLKRSRNNEDLCPR